MSYEISQILSVDDAQNACGVPTVAASTRCNIRECRHLIHTGTREARALIYREHGRPENVLKMEKVVVPALNDESVLLTMLASPINPADINQIEGVYPVQPPLPAVGGNEGVGVVTWVGSKVKELKEGDWVIPRKSGWGTWRTMAVATPRQLVRLPEGLPLLDAACIAVNPCTAYRMLRDFVTLSPGDIIVQNGANSGVGRCVIQMARDLGVRTINVVRDRPNIDELVSDLKGLGATHVVTDAFLGTAEMKKLLADIAGDKKPMLALNMVGGKCATDMLRLLGQGGTMVTYGGMAKKPLTIPTGSLIFSDLNIRGFWMTRWNDRVGAHGTCERTDMLRDIGAAIKEGRLKQNLAGVPVESFADAFASAATQGTAKQVLLISAQTTTGAKSL